MQHNVLCPSTADAIVSLRSRPRPHNALCAPAGTLRTTFVSLCPTPGLREHNHNTDGQAVQCTEYMPFCYNLVTKHPLFVGGQGPSIEPGGGQSMPLEVQQFNGRGKGSGGARGGETVVRGERPA